MELKSLFTKQAAINVLGASLMVGGLVTAYSDAHAYRKGPADYQAAMPSLSSRDAETVTRIARHGAFDSALVDLAVAAIGYAAIRKKSFQIG
jgi:hypothetical protein